MKKKKIVISADMEGIVNVSNWNDNTSSGTETPHARKWYTNSANAVIKACHKRGYDVILVDEHGCGDNFIIDELNQDIELVNSWPHLLGDVLKDDGISGLILLGYHVRAGSISGCLSHNIRSPILQIKIGGEVVSEGLISSMVAGHFDIPVIMASGDFDFAQQFTKELGCQIPISVCKKSLSRSSVKSIMPEKSYKDLYETALEAIDNIDNFKPKRAKGFDLEISLYEEATSERILYLPWVELLENDKPGRTVKVKLKSILEIEKFLEFVSGCIVK